VDGIMTSLSARSADVTDQVLAVLAAAYPFPVSSRTVEERTGYGPGHGQVADRMLNRLAQRGEVEKFAFSDDSSRYWRLAALLEPVNLPEPDTASAP
jgi:hypothetical protein